jgi:hypothetical protein
MRFPCGGSAVVDLPADLGRGTHGRGVRERVADISAHSATHSTQVSQLSSTSDAPLLCSCSHAISPLPIHSSMRRQQRWASGGFNAQLKQRSLSFLQRKHQSQGNGTKHSSKQVFNDEFNGGVYMRLRPFSRENERLNARLRNNYFCQWLYAWHKDQAR